MAQSKKALTMAKLEAFQALVSAGVVTKESIAPSVKDGLANGDIAFLTESAFEGKSAELLTFAKDFGLVKENGAVPSGFHKTGYLALIKSQYPETVAAIDAFNELSKNSYSIVLESGEKITVQPMPFARNISPKASDATKGETTETV